MKGLKIKRKLVSMSLISTLMLSVVACGNEAKNEDTTGTNSNDYTNELDNSTEILDETSGKDTEDNSTYNVDENGVHKAFTEKNRWLTSQDFSGEPATKPLMDFDAKYMDDAEDQYHTLDLPLSIDDFTDLTLRVQNVETGEWEQLDKEGILSSTYTIGAGEDETFWYYHVSSVEAENNENLVGRITLYNNSEEDMTIGQCFENNWLSYMIWCEYYGQFGYDYYERKSITNPNGEDISDEAELINFMTYMVDNVLGNPSKIIMQNNLFGYVEKEELANAYLDSTLSLYSVAYEDQLAVDSYTLVWEYEDRVFTIMLTDGYMISWGEIVPSMSVRTDSNSGEFYTLEQWEYSKDNIANEDKNILPYIYPEGFVMPE